MVALLPKLLHKSVVSLAKELLHLDFSHVMIQNFPFPKGA